LFALHYHDATKHYFNRFARSLGYLDWAAQPDPFRRYHGAPLIELARVAVAGDVPYDALFDSLETRPPLPMDQRAIGEFLRCSMGCPRGSSISPRVGRCASTRPVETSTRPSATSSGTGVCAITRRASTRSKCDARWARGP
jgi:hypothetical protein